MTLLLIEISTTTTKKCNMQNEDINLFKFTFNILIIIFTTWLIETNSGFERVFIMPFVCVGYACLSYVINKFKKG